MSDQENDYVIRNLAYELWEKAGRPPGKHLDFWEQAKRRMRQEATTQASASSRGDDLPMPLSTQRKDGDATG